MSVTVAALTLTVPLSLQHSDFFIFWDSVRWQLAGHDLYTAPHRMMTWQGPNLNPPALLALIVPLAALPLELAQAVWMAVSVAMFGASAVLVARELRLPAARVFALLLISQATFAALKVGGFVAPLTLAMTIAWTCDRRGHDRAAGWWLGIAIACKVFLLPFVGYAVIRRRWAMLGGIVASALFVFGLGVVLFGWKNTALWVHSLADAPPVLEPLNASLMGWLWRADVGLEWWVAGSMLIGAVLVHTWLDAERDTHWLGIISGALLISPLGWAYYAPLMVGPFAAVRSRWVWAGYLLLCVPVDLLIRSDAYWWTLTGWSAYFAGLLALFVSSLSQPVSSVRIGTREC